MKNSSSSKQNMLPNYDELMGEFKMTSSVEPKIKFLIVEGDSDRLTYSQFVKQPWELRVADERWPGNGQYRKAVTFARNMPEAFRSQIHVLVDQDFELTILGEKAFRSDHLSYTDKNDLETTIASTQAFEVFIGLCFDEKSFWGFLNKHGIKNTEELCEKLFHWSAKIGKIRFSSRLLNLNISFKNPAPNYEALLDLENLRVSNRAVWGWLLNAGDGIIPKLRRDRSMLQALRRPHYNQLENHHFTQGHDFCGFLAALGKKFVKAPASNLSVWDRFTVETCLLACVKLEHLWGTRMGETLQRRSIIPKRG